MTLETVLSKMDITKTQFDSSTYGVVNLKVGAPSNALLKKCKDCVRKGAIQRFEEPDSHLAFQYGPEAGDLRFRTEFSKCLTEEYKDQVQVNDLIVTNGASQGLYMLSSLLFSRGDVVFVEDPTYFLALKLFQDDMGFRCVPVLMDEEGVNTDIMEEKIKENLLNKTSEVDRNKPFSAMVYLIPTFHNPTGVCLSPDRCRKVVEMARKYNLLVVCDDVYNLLAFDPHEDITMQRKRLFAYDNPNDPDYAGNIVSNGTFSKIFGPGMRLGWLEVPARVKNIVLTSAWLDSSGCFNHTVSLIMTSVITLGLLKDHLKESRCAYKRGCDAICSVFREKVPSATFIQPKGGYFLWVKLPAPLKAADLLERCVKEWKICFPVGNVTSPTSQFKDCIRLCYCFYEVDVLTDAAVKITDTIISMLDKDK